MQKILLALESSDDPTVYLFGVRTVASLVIVIMRPLKATSIIFSKWCRWTVDKSR